MPADLAFVRACLSTNASKYGATVRSGQGNAQPARNGLDILLGPHGPSRAMRTQGPYRRSPRGGGAVLPEDAHGSGGTLQATGDDEVPRRALRARALHAAHRRRIAATLRPCNAQREGSATGSGRGDPPPVRWCYRLLASIKRPGGTRPARRAGAGCSGSRSRTHRLSQYDSFTRNVLSGWSSKRSWISSFHERPFHDVMYPSRACVHTR